MKRRTVTIISLVIIALVAPAIASAQATKASYFMTTSHARHYLNPALYPDRGYVGVPMVGNFYAGGVTNTFTLDNFLFLQGDPVKPVTFLHKSISPETFLAGISDNNYFSSDIAIDMISIGFAGKKNFWNFHVGLRVNVNTDLPRSLFEFVKVGFADQDATTTYDISGVSVSARAHAEIGVGYARSFLDDRLHVGVRPKLLLGLGEARANIEQLRVSASENAWSVQSRASLVISAPGISTRPKENGSIKGFNFDKENLPGIGGAIDIGGSFRLFDFGDAGQLTVSAAVNDIGFIKWSAKNTINAKTAEMAVVIEPKDYSVGEDGSSIEDVLDDALEKFQGGLDFFPESTAEAYSEALNARINAGVEYAVLNDKISVGALYSREQVGGNDMNTCTLSANFRPCYWLAASASYSLFTSRPAKSMGLALHLSPRVGPALFIASDCALAKVSKSYFLPVGSRDLSLQVGLTFNTGGKR
ncbi:MAG: DUF5723 family protein [Odoribacteraceae bacterium]|jgi:hypothetical protein|nr:DUF5723 family protein [Odoribacteraceae bacterium]